MDTTVITVEPADYGVGASDRVVFADSPSFHVNERGDLYVAAPVGKGNQAAFPHGAWRAVLRGDLAEAGDDVTRASMGGAR